MQAEQAPVTPAAPQQHLHDPQAEVVAFLRARSFPCPRCSYDLRDIQNATCPECGEPLVLKIGSPRARFGWLVLAMVPGSFSGVAAVILLLPISFTIGRSFPPGQGLPWPILAADIFGFLSAASVAVMYRHRHRVMALPARRQAAFAAGVWSVHILMLVFLILAMWLLQL